MAVIVCTSGPDSPGVTTTALGLTLTWPRDVLLADCDREPAQAVQAGYLRGMDLGGRGLAALTRVHRENRPLLPEIRNHAAALREGESIGRRFLPGFTVPAAVKLFDVVWPDLADAFAKLEEQGIDVIVDAGHVGREGLPLSLLARADAVCFITRSSLRSLAAARLHLPTLTGQLRQLPTDKPLGLVVVGPERPYASSEIAAQFGIPCWFELDWLPQQADVLSDGEPEPKRFESRALMNQMRAGGILVGQRITGSRSLTTGEPVHV